MSPWWIAAAFGSGFEVAQQGAIAGGTGHAGVARTDDPALAALAPAALADDGGVRIAMGAAGARSRLEAREAGGAWGVLSVPRFGTPPHAYASVAWDRNVVGFALHTPFAGSLRWPDAWPLSTTVVTSAPSVVRFAPFIGRRFGRVRLSIGPHVDVGQLRVSRRTDHVTELGWARIQVSGVGVGLDLATFVEVAPTFAVGVTYKSRTSIGQSGGVDFDVPPSAAARLPDQRVTSRLALPDQLTVGARLGDQGVRGLVDVAVTMWAVNEALTFDFALPETPDTTQINDWRTSVAVRGGIEADVRAATLRLGGYVDGLPEAPPPDETLSASSPDGLRLAATLGIGIAFSDTVRLDGFGEWLQILARTSSLPGAEVAYRGRAIVGGLTLSIHP